MTEHKLDPAARQVPASVSLAERLATLANDYDSPWKASGRDQDDALLEWMAAARSAMLEAVAALQGQVQASVTPDGWQPIATAPKDADVLLLYLDGSGVQPGYWQERWLACETQCLTGGRWHSEPTHWMPLPAPPTAGDAPRAASVTPEGWQPIETAPDDGTWFLAWDRDSEFTIQRRGHGFIAAEEPDATHWMPLPAPPGDAPQAAAPAEPKDAMDDKLNFHAIIGPNGMCKCGVEADGTVVTCGALLEAMIQRAVREAGSVPSPALRQQKNQKDHEE